MENTENKAVMEGTEAEATNRAEGLPEEIKQFNKKIDLKNFEASGSYYNRFWEVYLLYGYHSKYDYPVYAVKVRSKLGTHAQKTFMYDDFVFHFDKKVKPVLGVMGYLGVGNNKIIQNDIITVAETMMQNDEYIDLSDKKDQGIEYMLADETSSEDVDKYFDNLMAKVKEEPDNIACKSENNFDKNKHNGAWLDTEYYKSKNVYGKETLAIMVSKFSDMIDLGSNKVKKSFVEAFVRSKYILTGENSHTVEKDITLATGKQERCYVINLDRETLGLMPIKSSDSEGTDNV